MNVRTGLSRRQALAAMGALPAAALMTHPAAAAAPASVAPVARRFKDPWLELVRLLRGAAEVKHALLVQYLFAGYSLKPDFAALAGDGSPDGATVLGAAIRQMRHLSTLNQLLVALGAAPHLEREDGAALPLPFRLEPLSRHSAAKYAHAEAPAAALEPLRAKTPMEQAVVAMVRRELRDIPQPGHQYSHVGAPYDAMLAVLDELEPDTLAEPTAWRAELARIRDEGEQGHFRLFRSVLTWTHPALAGRPNGWKAAPGSAPSPSYALLPAPNSHGLATLGNLHYWATLCLLDFSYRTGTADMAGLARAQMTGPLAQLSRALAAGHGLGMPFDRPELGAGPGKSPQHSMLAASRLMTEARLQARSLGRGLPAGFDLAAYDDALARMAEHHPAAQEVAKLDKP